jgi:hypothetical protein
MKTLRKIIGFLLFGAIFFVVNSCTEDNPTYENINFIGCSTPGNLEVKAKDQVGMYYMGGAEVFLYKTMAERDNDPQRTAYYRKAATDQTDPQNIGAVFYELQYQKYFYAVRWTHPTTGKVWVGAGEAFVPACMTTKVTVDMQ